MSDVSRLTSTNDELQAEFDEWVRSGRANELEHHHAYITQQALRLMNLKRGDRVLDLGCGTGWATCWLAQLVRGQGGHAVGLDVSTAMIEAAARRAHSIENVSFEVGSAERMPFADSSFDQVLCVESFYYYPDLRAVLKELNRVITKNGRIFILNDLYADRIKHMDWSKNLRVPVHVLSEREYVDLLNSAGFGEVTAVHIPDQPAAASKRIRNLLRQPWRKWLSIVVEHFRHSKEVTQYRQAGALLLTATRVQSETSRTPARAS